MAELVEVPLTLTLLLRMVCAYNYCSSDLELLYIWRPHTTMYLVSSYYYKCVLRR